MHGSHNIRGNRIAAGRLCNTEIRYLHLAVFTDHNILRLDVTVNDSVIVRSFQTHGDLNGNADGFLHGKALFFLDIAL